MNAQRKIGLFCVALIAGSAARSQAQELHFLSNRVNQALDANREAARDWFSSIAGQPRDVRSAALELSQYPELVVRLKYVDGPMAVEKIALDSPEALRPSIKLLALHPEIVSRMSSQLVATTLAGQVYRSEPAVVSALIEQMNQAAVERTEGAVKGWKDRMLRDGTAQQQWQDVRMASRAPGMTVTAGLADFPTAAEVSYALTNAETYAELAAEMLDQWEAERNPEDFRLALDMWYAKHHDVLPDAFSMDVPLLVELVREHARFEKEFAKLGVTGTIDRKALLETRANEFPTLLKVRDSKALARLRAKPIRVAGAPWSSSSGSSGSSSSGSSSSRSSGMGGSSRTSRSSNRSDNSTSVFASGGSSTGRGSRSSRSRNSRSDNNNSGGSSNSGFGGNSGSSGGFGGSGGGFGGSGGGFGGSSGGFGGSSGGFGGSSSGSSFGQSGSSRFGNSNNN
jgi:hypothetical protein